MQSDYNVLVWHLIIFECVSCRWPSSYVCGSRKPVYENCYSKGSKIYFASKSAATLHVPWANFSDTLGT